jgi:hypothetical protein
MKGKIFKLIIIIIIIIIISSSSSSSSIKPRDSWVGIATGYGMDDRDSIPGKGKRFFSSPQRLSGSGPT